MLKRTIEHADIIRLSLADQETFARTLLAPPEPGPALKRAFARRRELLQPDRTDFNSGSCGSTPG